MEALAWYNVIFYIPLMLGILMVLGMALGFTDFADVDLDADADVDVDVDADHDVNLADQELDFEHDHDLDDIDHDHPNQHSIMTLLGFGRCPVSIVLMTMCFLFGASGAFINMMVLGTFSPLLTFVISFVSALTIMVFGTSMIARGVARIMPSTETTSVRAWNIVGSTGTTLWAAEALEPVSVIAKVKGDVYQVNAVSEQPLEKSQRVYLIDHDEEDNIFTVVPIGSDDDEILK